MTDSDARPESAGDRRTGSRLPASAALLVAIAAAVSPCACGRGETAEERVTRLRAAHRVQPDGFQPRRSSDGASELVISVLALNTGRERLPWLTILVHVQDAAGADRVAVRAPLDTSKLVPGVTTQLSAVVAGVEVGPQERVLVELEGQPPRHALAELPEYASGGRGER